MPNWEAAIFDRTEDDLYAAINCLKTGVKVPDNLKKMFFNMEDWNRITQNQLHLNDLMQLCFRKEANLKSLYAAGVSNGTLSRDDYFNGLVESNKSLRSAFPFKLSEKTIDIKFSSGLDGTAPDYAHINLIEEQLNEIKQFTQSLLILSWAEIDGCGLAMGNCGKLLLKFYLFEVF